MLTTIINESKCKKIRRLIYNTMLEKGDDRWAFSSDRIFKKIYEASWYSIDGKLAMSTIIKNINNIREYIPIIYTRI